MLWDILMSVLIFGGRYCAWSESEYQYRMVERARQTKKGVRMRALDRSGERFRRADKQRAGM